MQFSTGFVLAALAAIAQAIQFDFDSTGFAPVAGVPITLKWSDASGPVTITLKNGPIGNLKEVEVIASGQTSGSFVWTPPKDIPTDTYALEITDGTNSNYSPQFTYVGDGVASTTATPSATTSGVTSTTSHSSSVATTTGFVSNTTMTTSTTATTSTSTRHSSTSSSTTAATTTPVNQNGSQRLASSLALIIGTIAAFAIFN